MWQMSELLACQIANDGNSTRWADDDTGRLSTGYIQCRTDVVTRHGPEGAGDRLLPPGTWSRQHGVFGAPLLPVTSWQHVACKRTSDDATDFTMCQEFLDRQAPSRGCVASTAIRGDNTACQDLSPHLPVLGDDLTLTDYGCGCHGGLTCEIFFFLSASIYS